MSIRDPRLVVIRLDGGGAERDTTDLTPLIKRFCTAIVNDSTTRITWSPSGRMLGITTGSGDVLIDIGAGAARVLHGSGFASEPRWSPDGERLVFSADSRGAAGHDQCDIYVIHSDGTGLADLTKGPAEDRCPSWSPDGRMIAFLRRQPGEEASYAPAILPHEPGVAPLEVLPSPPQYTYAVWVINADGTDERQLTDGVATDDEPAWSPDGRWVAYKSEEYPHGEDRLWVVGLDRSAPQEVSADLDGIGDIAWRPAMTSSPKNPE